MGFFEQKQAKEQTAEQENIARHRGVGNAFRNEVRKFMGLPKDTFYVALEHRSFIEPYVFYLGETEDGDYVGYKVFLTVQMERNNFLPRVFSLFCFVKGDDYIVGFPDFFVSMVENMKDNGIIKGGEKAVIVERWETDIVDAKYEWQMLMRAKYLALHFDNGEKLAINISGFSEKDPSNEIIGVALKSGDDGAPKWSSRDAIRNYIKKVSTWVGNDANFRKSFGDINF